MLGWLPSPWMHSAPPPMLFEKARRFGRMVAQLLALVRRVPLASGETQRPWLAAYDMCLHSMRRGWHEGWRLAKSAGHHFRVFVDICPAFTISCRFGRLLAKCLTLVQSVPLASGETQRPWLAAYAMCLHSMRRGWHGGWRLVMTIGQHYRALMGICPACNVSLSAALDATHMIFDT